MASLLTDLDKSSFQGSILDLFDTFSRDIEIHKAPKKKITDVNPTKPPLPGYGNSSSPTNIEYIPEFTTRKAIVQYGDKQTVETESSAGAKIPLGKVYIKVKSDTRDYINKGGTEKIVIDNKSFKLATTDSVKNYFGLKLYVYFIEEIN
jgi:hypothetical protein